MNKLYFLILSMGLLLVSCREDSVVPIDDKPDEPVVEIMYVKSVFGTVIGPEGQPVSQATLEVQGKMTQTNEYGIFKIEDVDVSNVKGAFVKVQKEGYFTSGFRIYGKSIDKENVNIELVPKTVAATINASTGGEAQLNNGTQIEFDAGDIAADGVEFNGLVNVYAYYLDPSESDFLDRSPGDLSGLREDGSRVILNSFGMLAVDLESTSGEILNVAPGKTAKITVRVPNDLLSDAPSTIPLWHFDEQENRWVEEGEAELVNGVYVGEVSHFSWWNCDDFSDPINLCVTINQPIKASTMPNVEVVLCSANFGTSSGTTNESGEVCGLVPSGEVITLKLYSICGDAFYTEDIGPFTSSPQSIDLSVTIPNNTYDFTFDGQINDCSLTTGVADAYVRIEVDENSFVTVADASGNYLVNQVLCDPSVNYNVIGVDPLSGSAGNSNGTAVEGVVNTLDVELCSQGTEFLDITTDLGNLNLTSGIELKMKANETLILAGNDFMAGFRGTTTGTFPLDLIVQGGSCDGSNCTITINQFGPVGSYVVGKIDGTLSGNGGPVSGVFSALRIE